MPDYNQLSDGRPDGTLIGQSASDKVAFHNATPTAQSAAIASLTASTTLTQAVVLIQQITQVLKDKGLIA